MLEEKLTAGIIVKETYDKRIEQSNLIDIISNYIFEYDLDIFLGPEWLFLPEKKLYSKSEKDKIIKQLAKKTKSKDTLIIPGSIMWYDKDYFYNTAPIISKGQLVKECHKYNDGGSKCLAIKRDCRKPLYQKASNDVFMWKDYRAGVEICSDHGRLRKTLEESNEPFLDLYFLVSCGIRFSYKDLPLKNLGYSLCSDGSFPSSAVLQKKGAFFKGIKHEELKNMYVLYKLVMELS